MALIEASVSYPEIKNPNHNEVIETINLRYQTLAEEYLKFVPDGFLEYALESKAAALEYGYDFMPFPLGKTYCVSYDKNNLLCVIAEDYSYTGGAHPCLFRCSETIGLETGESILITALLKGTEDEIFHMIAEKFISKTAQDPSMYYEDALEIIRSELIYFRYYLEEEGIVFFTQRYEIAPYAAGFPTVNTKFSEDVFLLDLK